VSLSQQEYQAFIEQKAVVERQSAEIELLKQQVQGLVEKIQEVEYQSEQRI
jgi:hypothetical protein